MLLRCDRFSKFDADYADSARASKFLLQNSEPLTRQASWKHSRSRASLLQTLLVLDFIRDGKGCEASAIVGLVRRLHNTFAMETVQKSVYISGLHGVLGS